MIRAPFLPLNSNQVSRRIAAALLLLATGPKAAPVELPRNLGSALGPFAGHLGRGEDRSERSAVGNRGVHQGRDSRLGYQINPRLGFSLDVSNLFNEPIANYRGIAAQMERTIINGTNLNLGLTGRF